MAGATGSWDESRGATGGWVPDDPDGEYGALLRLIRGARGMAEGMIAQPGTLGESAVAKLRTFAPNGMSFEQEVARLRENTAPNDSVMDSPNVTLPGEEGFDPFLRAMKGPASERQMMNTAGMAAPLKVGKWVSTLERALEKSSLKKGTPEQWEGIFKNTPGLKPEELEWTGVSDFLRGRKGTFPPELEGTTRMPVEYPPVTRDELLELAKKNRVGLSETNLGHIEDISDWSKGSKLANRTLDDAGGDFSWASEDLDRKLAYAKNAVAEAEAREAAARLPAYGVQTYDVIQRQDEDVMQAIQMRMRAEDQRAIVEEAVATLAKMKSNVGRAADGPTQYERWSDKDSIEGGTYQERLIRPTIGGKPIADAYSSQHFNSEGDGLLAHQRGGIVKDAQGNPMTYSDEFQSDLMSDARKYGFVDQGGPEVKKTIETLQRELEDLGVQEQNLGRELANQYGHRWWLRVPTETDNLFNELVAQQAQRREQIARLKGGGELPGAHASRVEKAKAERKILEDQALGFDDELHTKYGYDWWNRIPKDELKRRDKLQAEFQRKSQEVFKLTEGAISPHMAVPNVPFKNDAWEDALIKRLMMDAAADSHGKIAWSTGATQIDRYNLAKHYGGVQYSHSGTSGFTPRDQINTADDGMLEVFDKAGKRVKEEFVPRHRLSDWLPADVVDRLLYEVPGEYGTYAGTARVTKKLTGLDLQTGGAGKTLQYDQRIPKKVAKMIREYGGTVQKENIGREPIKFEIKVGHMGAYIVEPTVVPGAGRRVSSALFRTRAEAQEYIDAFNKERVKEVWTATLPEKLRKKINEEGFPILSVPAALGTGKVAADLIRGKEGDDGSRNGDW